MDLQHGRLPHPLPYPLPLPLTSRPVKHAAFWNYYYSYSQRVSPQAKVKREESLKASSPQRLNFSRRRTHIPAAMPS